MAAFFTADTHFGHAGALGLYRRPFTSVAAMNEALVERWNAVVGPDDEVWHLGDFALRLSATAMAELLARLHGQKHLVSGNNDGAETIALAGWRSVRPYHELTICGTTLVLCHYAFRTWSGMAKGAINLHGHSHGRLQPLSRQRDVGVDAWDFQPIRLAQILKSATRRGVD